MSDNTLMLLFQGGLFLLTFLTFIVLLIDRISKK
ncbi:MAG TPA: putative holin-like toxin [Clostridium sp.]|nr:putative holin-like toxin [Clostridium sp.]